MVDERWVHKRYIPKTEFDLINEGKRLVIYLMNINGEAPLKVEHLIQLYNRRDVDKYYAWRGVITNIADLKHDGTLAVTIYIYEKIKRVNIDDECNKLMRLEDMYEVR